MKKLLLGTTALAAAAAFSVPALAADKIELGLRGFFTGATAYADIDDVDLQGPVQDDNFEEVLLGTNSEIHFIGKTTLDNGLQIGFRAELELEADNRDDIIVPDDNPTPDIEDDLIDEVYLQIDGGFGRVQLGQQDGVADQMIISAPNVFSEVTISSIDQGIDPFRSQYAFLSREDVTGDSVELNRIDTAPDYTDDKAKIIFITPRIAGLQVGASFQPVNGRNGEGIRFDETTGQGTPSDILDDNFGNNYVEVAANFKHNFGTAEVGVSASYGTGEGGNAAEDPEEYHVGAQVKYAGFTLGGAFKEAQVSGNANVDKTQVFDAGLTYETGPWTVGASYGQTDGPRDDEQAFFSDDLLQQRAIIGGMAYKFGPGMEVGFGGMFFSDESQEIVAGTGPGAGTAVAQANLGGDKSVQVDSYAVFSEINVNF